MSTFIPGSAFSPGCRQTPDRIWPLGRSFLRKTRLSSLSGRKPIWRNLLLRALSRGGIFWGPCFLGYSAQERDPGDSIYVIQDILPNSCEFAEYGHRSAEATLYGSGLSKLSSHIDTSCRKNGRRVECWPSPTGKSLSWASLFSQGNTYGPCWSSLTHRNGASDPLPGTS